MPAAKGLLSWAQVLYWVWNVSFWVILTVAYVSQSFFFVVIQAAVRRSTPSIVLPYQSPDYVNHIAIDLGGSLIKLVYFSTDTKACQENSHRSAAVTGHNVNGRGGRLHFVKFETNQLADALAFIHGKGLHMGNQGGDGKMRVVATGGGAHRFADVFRKELGLVLEKEDEMECLVYGCNFLLSAIPDEAFSFQHGVTSYRRLTDGADLYPYLLVNIGSGVSIVKVDGEGKYERVSGSSLGGGTFWGLCRLLTKVTNFDEMLELSMKGNNQNVDMMVGDIYGGRDYAQIGLAADIIASSFGKVVSQDMDLEDCSPADLALALCRMVSYNIGHLAYLNAMRYNLKRVIFGGFFIRGHAYTMDTISYAIQFWSKGSMDALFLRHEGFLGAMGAFLKVHPITPPAHLLQRKSSKKFQGVFSEQYPMGAPVAGGYVKGPVFHDVTGKVSWVERFVQMGKEAAKAAQESNPEEATSSSETNLSNLPVSPSAQKLGLHVGVLHFKPSERSFPLLADPENYEPNTIDITSSADERSFWVNVLQKHIPTVVEMAVASEGGGLKAQRRGQALAVALSAHLSNLDTESYGLKGLADLLEIRELCLREFEFMDAYRLVKERENTAALQVLPDLLRELDLMAPRERLLALVQGALAANIFDWGSQECIEKYKEGTILSIYKDARERLTKRPWRIDTFDAFEEKIFGDKDDVESTPFRRVLIFVDNAGADVVLGMIPLAREFLKFGCDVVLAGNSLPAINDITAKELEVVVSKASQHCGILASAHEAGTKAMYVHQGSVPPAQGMPFVSSSGDLLAQVPPQGSNNSETAWDGKEAVGPRLYIVESGSGSPCLDLRCVSAQLARAAPGTDLTIIEGMGRAVHTNLWARFKCSSLKIAMIKTQRVAEKLFNGQLYDSICVFEPAPPS